MKDSPSLFRTAQGQLRSAESSHLNKMKWNLCLLLGLTLPALGAGLDRNRNSLNDIWESVHAAESLAASLDTDGDGFTNGEESNAGTNPFDPASHSRLDLKITFPSSLRLHWKSAPGKRYSILSSPSLPGTAWNPIATQTAERVETSATMTAGGLVSQFFRLTIDDVDSDGDGLTDYEEHSLGFNPHSQHSDRYPAEDLNRVVTGLTAANIVTLSVLDPLMSERWPDPGLVVIRRRGGLSRLHVNIEIGGTATRDSDYATSVQDSVTIPAGVREVWLEFHPVIDGLDNESDETITVTLQPGSSYTVGSGGTVTLVLHNQTGTDGPSAKEAARFLLQASFGPDEDSPDDADSVPENVEEVMAVGFPNWIDDQFARPIGRLQPMTEWVRTYGDAMQLYTDAKAVAWWGRAMGSAKLAPDSAQTQLSDPLRQRVAFALSEILVISDRPEELAVEPVGMANYYDVLLKHAFGNYRDLLFEVAMHPCMGIYLSHVGNKKADPANHIYPDENFAREIMQLFTIGLWQLNQDGSHKLDATGQPIPTYDNGTITEMARVFTGLGFGGPKATAFSLWPRDFTRPMLMWDAFHDCQPKTLPGGLPLPARIPSTASNGVAGLADINAAIDNLFQHPNVGPFLGRRLIQRFVTSNPSPAYIAHVASAFANNGSGVRGDLKAVVKAVLLDSEARDYAKRNDPTFGKLREPFLRVVNFARAFNATSPSGIYALSHFSLDHAQEPQSAASVFNFFQPGHQPSGTITLAGLVAPEFQIINASTAITAPNYFWNAVWDGLHRWGVGNPELNVTLNLAQEMAMVVPAALVAQDVPSAAPFDPDPLLQRLDLVLTGGTLSPPQFQIIRETLERIPRPSWQWHKQYLRTAIYLIVTSPDFCVLR